MTSRPHAPPSPTSLTGATPPPQVHLLPTLSTFYCPMSRAERRGREAPASCGPPWNYPSWIQLYLRPPPQALSAPHLSTPA
uniref:Uncharacterized protein n=1 Tax=Setaria italica TaxID=4555 RepID=K3Y0H3_SETIT